MTRIVSLSICIVLSVAFISGCDQKPEPIRDPQTNKITETIQVSPENGQEIKLVTDSLKAEVNYRYRLTVLREYYDYIGNADKFAWANNELANLDDARWFQWVGAAEVVPPSGESVVNADERLLVESVLQARRAYKKAMSNLEKLYADNNDQFKLSVVQQVQKRFDPVRTYMYYFAAELPTVRGRDLHVIPEAEAIYKKAYDVYTGGQIVFSLADYSKERQALVLFLELLDKYPTSTKCSAASFYIGQIYREYFDEDVRSVQWYQRAWELDPDIELGARFQAAVVYDFRLHDRARAYELYKEVLKHETSSWNHRRYSKQRIVELEQKYPDEILAK